MYSNYSRTIEAKVQGAFQSDLERFCNNQTKNP